MNDLFRCSDNRTNTGTSYNFFDSGDNTWNQVWISSTDNVLELKGHVNKEGAMVLKSKLVNGSNGKYYNQITWSQRDTGSVVQRCDILNQDSKPLSVAFEGIYQKRDN